MYYKGQVFYISSQHIFSTPFPFQARVVGWGILTHPDGVGGMNISASAACMGPLPSASSSSSFSFHFLFCRTLPQVLTGPCQHNVNPLAILIIPALRTVADCCHPCRDIGGGCSCHDAANVRAAHLASRTMLTCHHPLVRVAGPAALICVLALLAHRTMGSTHQCLPIPLCP